MAALSDYAANKLLDHVLGTAAFTMPPQVYASLHTADPTQDGSVGAVAVARVAVDFSASSGRRGVLAADATWTGVPASTVTHIALWDALTDGNCLSRGRLVSSRAIEAGGSVTFQAGEIVAEFQ